MSVALGSRPGNPSFPSSGTAAPTTATPVGVYFQTHPTTAATVAVWMQTTAGGTPTLMFRVPTGTANLPTGAKYQNYNRGLTGTTDCQLVLGQPMVFDLGELIGGDVISTASLDSGGTAGAGMTHSWIFIMDKATRAVYAKSNDDTSNWGSFAPRNFTFAGGFTVPTTAEYYLGCVVAGTTAPSLRGAQLYGVTAQRLPRVVALTADTGLLAPATLGATAGALSAPAGNPGWPYVSLA